MNSKLAPEQQKQLSFWLKKINSDLLANCIAVKDCTYWKTLETGKKDNERSFYKSDTSVYKGNGGIILYLLQLYEYSGNARYLQLAGSKKNWLIQEAGNEKTTHTAFYTGKAGVIFVCAKMYEVTGDENYLKHSLYFLNKYDRYFRPHYSDDLLSGTAGNLLVLAKVYQLTELSWVYELFQDSLNDLIDNVFIDSIGLKWRYRPNFIDSLCGFSHGAAGIGFSLIELGNFFDSDTLLWLGEQAYLYEDQHYSAESCSWPDLRIHPEKLKNPHLVQNPAQLMKGEMVNGWAHGGIGIALTRVRAFQVTGKKVYKESAVSVIAHSIQEYYKQCNPYNYTLTNGFASLCYLLIYAGEVFKDPSYLSHAYTIVNDAMALKERVGFLPSGWDVSKPDFSFFMGELGIGCCILYLSGYKNPGNPILPCLDSKAKTLPNKLPGLSDVKYKILKRYFPNTLQHASGVFACDDMAEGVYETVKKTEVYLSGLPVKQQKEVRQHFLIESEKLKLELEKPCFRFISESFKRVSGESPFSDLSNVRLALCKYVRLVPVSDADYLLLVKRRYGVEEYPLNGLVLKLVETLQYHAKTFHEIVVDLKEDFPDELSAGRIEEILKSQVEKCVEADIIKQVGN